MIPRRLARFIWRHCLFNYGPPPLLSFDDAHKVGLELHDHWEKMAGIAPMPRDDMGWSDLAQFTVRKAREVAGG